MTPETSATVVKSILRHWDNVIGIYLFGSAADGSSIASSDVDLAILADSAPDVEQMIKLRADLAHLLKKDVDIVDLRRADSVTKVQVIDRGQLLYQKTPLLIAEFETWSLSQYALLNEERREIVEEIVNRGNIYG